MGQQLSFEVPDGLQEAIARRAAAIVAARDRPASEPWVGVAEAAAHLACKRQRIYDLVHRRIAPGSPTAKRAAACCSSSRSSTAGSTAAGGEFSRPQPYTEQCRDPR